MRIIRTKFGAQCVEACMCRYTSIVWTGLAYLFLFGHNDQILSGMCRGMFVWVDISCVD